MHGPHEFDSTTAPSFSKSASRPSRAIVARTCSLPGEINSLVFAVIPCASAWRAIDAARVMSSYDELVHEPINRADASVGPALALAAGATFDPGRARWGVCGPLIHGWSDERSTSLT